LFCNNFGPLASRLFTVTGAVEAEKGAQEEHMCNQEKNNINFMNFHDIPRSWLDTKDTRKLLDP